jgi:preprotein translocase subunit SecB
MSETPNEPAAAPQGPVLRVVNQYLKDLSFENPNAPNSLRTDLPPPAVEVAVDVNARKLGNDQYEVELACNASATRDGEPVFLVETNFAGHFIIQNVTDEQLEQILLVEGPRILFPFARQIIANATRDGGFLPLLLEPLDFSAMYRIQRQRAAQQPTGNA